MIWFLYIFSISVETGTVRNDIHLNSIHVSQEICEVRGNEVSNKTMAYETESSATRYQYVCVLQKEG